MVLNLCSFFANNVAYIQRLDPMQHCSEMEAKYGISTAKYVCVCVCIYMNMDCTVCTYFVNYSQIMMCLHFIKLDVS